MAEPKGIAPALYVHQLLALPNMHNGCILAGEPGSGKTRLSEDEVSIIESRKRAVDSKIVLAGSPAPDNETFGEKLRRLGVVSQD